MKQLLAAICACLALGLVAVGCGGDDDNGDNNDSGGAAATTEQTTTTEKQAAGGGGASAGKQVAVEIVDIDYDPKDETVPKGTTVKWTNTGKLPHTVTKEEGPGPDFDSGTLQPGDTYEETFTTPGKIAYLCTIHSGQDGSITVQ
ncbi:MAG TPA: plastocyanin/azurin family copper-binding protein [Thermoleophilaceae bacterium]|nr:plastocyanin/azurin family copper-binding protein [Thermoleophilaceae bacterium]